MLQNHCSCHIRMVLLSYSQSHAIPFQLGHLFIWLPQQRISLRTSGIKESIYSIRHASSVYFVRVLSFIYVDDVS